MPQIVWWWLGWELSVADGSPPPPAHTLEFRSLADPSCLLCHLQEADMPCPTPGSLFWS